MDVDTGGAFTVKRLAGRWSVMAGDEVLAISDRLADAEHLAQEASRLAGRGPSPTRAVAGERRSFVDEED